jgi:hypothetical protein
MCSLEGKEEMDILQILDFGEKVATTVYQCLSCWMCIQIDLSRRDIVL